NGGWADCQMPPPGYHEFEGMHPSGAGRATFIIAKNKILGHFRRTGNSQMYLDAMNIPAVMDSPCGIFEGLGRPGQEKNYCYCGVPAETHFRDDRITVPPPPGKTFTVFVTERLEIVKYGWDLEDPETGFPENHRTRFGRRTWPPE